MATEDTQDNTLEEEVVEDERSPEEVHKEAMLKRYEQENSTDDDDDKGAEEEEQSTDDEDSSTDKEDTKDKDAKDLPDNFKSVEDLAKSYKELQKAHTLKAQELANLKKGDTKTTSKETVQAGDLISLMTKDMIDSGGVTQETAELFNKAGYTPEQFSYQLKTTQAYLKQAEQEAYAITGGKEAYSEMIEWASENLTEGEIAIFNEQLKTDEDYAKFAIKGLYSQYKSNKKPSNKVELGTGTGDLDTSGTRAFKSWDQVTKAMKDPKYKSGDKAFIKQVQKRLAKSNL